MPTFTLIPDLRVLNRYLTSTTEEEFETANPGYEPHPIVNTLEWEIFKDEVAFERAFKDLLTKYQLIKHYDNLLYLVLYIHNEIWEEIQNAYDDYSSKKRAKEIAQLLLTLKAAGKGKLPIIEFKAVTSTAKTTDTLLNDWISKTLIGALERKQFPIGSFGNTVLDILSDEEHPLAPEAANVDKLKEYSNQRLVNPKNLINKGKASICLMVLDYLNGETDLKAPVGIQYTDAQLTFLFYLLELLGQVSSFDKVQYYKEKEYVRTLIANVLKVQMRQSKGNTKS